MAAQNFGRYIGIMSPKFIPAKAIVASLFLSLCALGAAQPFELGQTWNVYFEEATGWRVTLNSQTDDGLEGEAKGPTFGDPLSALLTEADTEVKSFLGLTGDYSTFVISYPTGIVTMDGAEILVCALPTGDAANGQAFGLTRSSTGLNVATAGTGCSATLASGEDAAEGSDSSWPPALRAGETWQVSVVQGGAEVASWNVQFDSGQAQELAGRATGLDTRVAEAAFFGDDAPQPSMANSWVFALGGQGTQPLYCVFGQEKPFTADSMTGTVMMMGATCTATKQ